MENQSIFKLRYTTINKIHQLTIGQFRIQYHLEFTIGELVIDH
jgi:hypothetical protein